MISIFKTKVDEQNYYRNHRPRRQPSNHRNKTAPVLVRESVRLDR